MGLTLKPAFAASLRAAAPVLCRVRSALCTAELSRRPLKLGVRAMSDRPHPRTHISASTAAELDRRLLAEHAFSLDQLMELAGLSVACAVMDYVQAELKSSAVEVAVVCGPGNNGGDGLVCARHLALFGFKVCVVCPVNRFPSLTKQLQAFRIPIVDNIPLDATLIVDALFGFSFSGPPVREPFPQIISAINKHRTARVVCVDVPSGWNVNKGNIYSNSGIRAPNAVVSLSAPKLCTLTLPSSCWHYLGGRFVPPFLSKDLGFDIPRYPGSSSVVILSNGGGEEQ
jgi:hydroxyethylthiazole kinase-like uncharacterized protein yjeF